MKLSPQMIKFLLVGTLTTSSLALAAEATDKGNTVAFKGLKKSDVTVVKRGLNTAVHQAVSKLSAGELSKNTKDCTRIDLTNKKICVEITIEEND